MIIKGRRALSTKVLTEKFEMNLDKTSEGNVRVTVNGFVLLLFKPMSGEVVRIPNVAEYATPFNLDGRGRLEVTDR